ncbi:hypothetical protein niasHS_004044 [Heterodera schachtii]|uniref:Homeobox domain-containing protein n=1 Tax=Heterodera schachtii TaxID=97005 RepID=A0ABD2JUP8_HETSC
MAIFCSLWHLLRFNFGGVPPFPRPTFPQHHHQVQAVQQASSEEESQRQLFLLLSLLLFLRFRQLSRRRPPIRRPCLNLVMKNFCRNIRIRYNFASIGMPQANCRTLSFIPIGIFPLPPRDWVVRRRRFGASPTNSLSHFYASNRKRRQRTIFSEEQLHLLEKAFRLTPYPEVNVRERLAERCALRTERVEVWFKNRRAKARKRAKESFKNA